MTNTITQPGATPGARPYPLARLDRLIERFQRSFPSFDDQRYRDEERYYKEHFGQRLRDLLGRDKLGALIEGGDFEGAKAAIKQSVGGTVVTPVGYRQQNNLLNQWDALTISNAPAKELAERLYALLYGEGPFDARFDAWVELLAGKRPGVWPPATYFLMAQDPAEHLMIKPSQWQLFFKEVGIDVAWPTRPNNSAYAWLRGIAHQLLVDLGPLGARDLLDVQSFLWRLSYQQTASWIFEADPALYDLADALNELDEISWHIPKFQDEIQPGQAVYLWEGGAEPGVVAVARVLSEPSEVDTSETDRHFHRGPQPLPTRDTRARIQIEQVLLEPLRRDVLAAHQALAKLAPLAQPNGAIYRLSNEEAEALATLVETDDDDEQAEPTETETAFDDLEEWQRGIVSSQPLVQRLVKDYPAWVAERFSGWVSFRGLQNQYFSLHVDGRRILRGRMNQSDGMYIWFPEPPEDLVDWLRSHLSRPKTLLPRTRKGMRGWRFIAYSDADYAALQEVTVRMVAHASTRDTTPPPNPLPGQAFVVIHGADRGEQRLGEAYVYTSYAGGAQRQLTEAVQAWRNGGGQRVYLIIYRPAPDHAFVGWGEVTAIREEPGDEPKERRYVLSYDWHPFPFPVSARTMTTHLSWLAKGLAVAFRGISIRAVAPDDVRAIAERAYPTKAMSLADAAFLVLSRAGGGPLYLPEILVRIQEEQLTETRGQTPQLSLSTALLRDERFHNIGRNTWVLTPDEPDIDEQGMPEGVSTLPLTRQPAVYAEADARFWRIHFPREAWDNARRAGVIAIGWPPDSPNQSVKRFRQIKVGDRVVAYVQGGVIGGIGVVTQAFDPAQPRAGLPPEHLGDEFNQYIRVAWADAPAVPIELLEALKHPHYTALYNRVKNPHTVIPLSRDDYTALLALLQVDDAGVPRSESRLPNVWLQLSPYLSLARSLGEGLFDAAALARAAASVAPPPAEPVDADDLVAELMQLRLIEASDNSHYRARAYVNGAERALLRLVALGLLIPAEGSADQYLLPARQILPRLRGASDMQPAQEFAPALGADGLTLLSWYAEAGLVVVDADTWQSVPDALTLLDGDDRATKAANQLLETLLAEADGRLETDLPHVPADEPLRPASNLEERLRELGAELLIDRGVVMRIYRSLMAGRHVVLSGPPGTGKTELARRLPSLLWREEPKSFFRLTLRPEQPPIEEVQEQRHGYASVIVTATEDWGVRDVVGGIGPRLDGQSGGLNYTIEHGFLTRTVLRHYADSDEGRRVPQPTQALERQDYRDEKNQRYRGAWLVIDEFTRAPIDAAFGSLLTTLSGGDEARLGVPLPSGEIREVPLPRDFRIIGTLNSFDRHFLNQLSEAMKRRFDFIDVLPPSPRLEAFEQGVAAVQALRRLAGYGFAQIERSAVTPQAWRWPGVLETTIGTDGEAAGRYQFGNIHADAEASLTSFWRLFSAIRVFRQLGTAQMTAIYTNLFTGKLIGMSWEEALDTALADALADQLQVLTRDEQRTIDAFVEHAGDPNEFVKAVWAILRDLPPGRRLGYLHALRERYAMLNLPGDTIAVGEEAQPSDEQIGLIFKVDDPLALPKLGVFRRRLRDLLGERGL